MVDAATGVDVDYRCKVFGHATAPASARCTSLVWASWHGRHSARQLLVSIRFFRLGSSRSITLWSTVRSSVVPQNSQRLPMIHLRRLVQYRVG
ncbi:hypothetical protein BHQ19_10310 [Mycolicibacterium porcinum]|nr:hypothetical protein BHQ19_10310 [Mycolicibacterium porcinum]